MRLWGILLILVLCVGCTKTDAIVQEGQSINSQFCDDLEKSIWSQYDTLDKSCEDDSDCLDLPLDCPMVCTNPVSKNADLTKIKQDCEIFKENGCTQSILARCRVTDIECIDNECTVVYPLSK